MKSTSPHILQKTLQSAFILEFIDQLRSEIFDDRALSLPPDIMEITHLLNEDDANISVVKIIPQEVRITHQARAICE